MEGERICHKGFYGTIRFLGEIQGKQGTWVGVEWDDPSRGKHSGEVEGTQYFTTKHPGHASFLKQEVLSELFFRTIGTAILEKYADRTEQDTSELYVPTVRNMRKEIELVGTEKIQQKQENLEALKEIDLQEYLVKEIDQGFGRAIVSCQKLLLDRNLLCGWNQVVMVLEELPGLHTLSLGNNRLELPLQTSFTHPLKVLVLNCMDLKWEELMGVFPCFPELEELHLFRNNCNVLHLIPEHFPNLKLLNLEDNKISSWEMVAQNCAQLPSLEKLILNSNNLEHIYYTEGFPKLEAISVEKNNLKDWRTVEELEKFPARIKELRISGNPELQNNLQVSLFRFMIIARIGELTTLNGSIVRPQERIDSERYFLRSNFNNPEATQSQRWKDLVEKHGDPSEIAGRVVSQQENLENQTVSSGTVEVLLRSLARASAGKEVKKNLPLSMNVGALKGLCSKLFSIPVPEIKLTYRESKDVIMPETLDDNLKDLDYYMLKDGAEVWIEDLN